MWPYYGRKMKVLKYYPEPKHDKIIEPFAGTAPYSLKYWKKEIILIDRYEIIIDLWKYLQNASPKDILSLPKIKLGDDIRTYKISEIEKSFMGFCINHGIIRPANIVSYFGYNYNGNWWENKKKRIAEDLYKIKHWKFICGNYTEVKNYKATWFIDPPYQYSKKKYPYNIINYNFLSNWCKKRKGQVIVCESNGANWLPFSLLTDNLKTGQTHKKQKELVWIKG